MVKAFLEASGDNVETSPSFYLFFDTNRYLFECGEGTQRYITQRNSFSLSRVTSLFVSTLTWESIGGLLGVIFTMDDMGIKEFNIYAPVGLVQVLRAATGFVTRRNIIVKVHEVTKNHKYTDDTVNIQIIPITSSNSTFSTLDTTNTPSITTTSMFGDKEPRDGKERDNHQLCNSTKSGAAGGEVILEVGETNNKSIDLDFDNRTKKKKTFKTTDIPETDQDNNNIMIQQTLPKDNESVHCYICSTHDLIGKFLPEKAKALGLTPGPVYRDLVAGKSVTLSEGTIIQPHQVMEESTPASNIGIIKCPSKEYFDSLIENQAFKEYYQGSKKMLTMFHTAPEEVLNDTKYIEFMERFGDTTKHVVINNENCEYFPSFQRSEQFVAQLSQLMPTVFPKPVNPPQTRPIFNGQGDQVASDNLKSRVMPINKITRVTMAPAQQAGDISYMSLADAIDDGKLADKSLLETQCQLIQESNETIRQSQTELKELIAESEERTKTPDELYPRILFTGTGSAIPSNYRNVSGIHVLTESGAGMLLDAGEGTYGQLARYYGDKIDYVLAGMRMIWISHIHADHHLGVPRILEKRQELEKKQNIKLPPLVVTGPPSMITWLNKMTAVIPMKYVGVTNDKLNHNDPLAQPALFDLGIDSIKSVPVIHCYKSYGVVITLKNGFKFTYSGDTRPCELLEKEGKGSNVLMHEATMSDELKEDAIAKRHSTVSEAIGVGSNMQAKWTILTHFSQRYPKMPILQRSDHETNVGLAFDLLQVAPYQYPLLQRLIKPAMDLINFDLKKEAKEREDSVFVTEIPKKVSNKQPKQKNSNNQNKSNNNNNNKSKKRKEIDNDNSNNNNNETSTTTTTTTTSTTNTTN